VDYLGLDLESWNQYAGVTSLSLPPPRAALSGSPWPAKDGEKRQRTYRTRSHHVPPVTLPHARPAPPTPPAVANQQPARSYAHSLQSGVSGRRVATVSLSHMYIYTHRRIQSHQTPSCCPHVVLLSYDTRPIHRRFWPGDDASPAPKPFPPARTGAGPPIQKNSTTAVVFPTGGGGGGAPAPRSISRPGSGGYPVSPPSRRFPTRVHPADGEMKPGAPETIGRQTHGTLRLALMQVPCSPGRMFWLFRRGMRAATPHMGGV
jgi:hypothetical protein